MVRFLKKHLNGDGGIRQLLVIAFPMIISQSCDTIMMFTDRIFLSRLTPLHMASAMSGGLTSFMTTTFFLGLIGYTTALVAQFYGAGRKDYCTVALTQSVLVAVLSYPVILSLIPFGLWLFRLSGHSALQQSLSGDYFKILMYGTLIPILRNSFNSFFSGIGKTRIVMISSLVTMTVNIVVNYFLIFGKGGFPALGIRGAAIGTIAGGLFGLIIVIAGYISYNISHPHYCFKRSLKFNSEVMKKLLRFGTPGGIEFFLTLFAFDLLVLLLQSYGADTAASVTIAFNWDMVSFLPLVGINIGVISLSGRFSGADKPELVIRSAYSGLKLAVLYGLLIAILFTVFSGPFVMMFLPDGVNQHRIMPLAKFMVSMVSFYVFADGCNLVFSGALRGAGDTFWTMLISVSFHWMLVAETVILVKFFHADPAVTWTFFVFSIPFMALAFYIRFWTGRWKKIKIIDRPDKI
ncbi:MAG: MATE family efflux transporter [Spirochaetes bacterium]|nr:MATE family efflux transporter [Spirochaetota bacterium]